MEPTLVFTDLDGTLLDLFSYQAGPARWAVSDLQSAGIPVIFCSSKTMAEQEAIRQDLGVDGPFIVENGSAVLVPDGMAIELGAPHLEGFRGYRAIRLGAGRAEITAILQAARRSLGLTFGTYADTPLSEVATLTGLEPSAAERAARRDFSETILTRLSSGEETALRLYLEERGLQMACGGRFQTVTGNGADKGRAVQALSELWNRSGTRTVTVGIGDSENDISLLAACDRRYLVRRPSGSWLETEMSGNVQYLPGVGPEGWCQMAADLLKAQV